MRFRSLSIPTLLILGLSVVGCDEMDPNQAAQSDLFEEKKDLKQSELEEVRWRVQDFLTEHEPGVTVQGFHFNQLTPNVYLVNAEITDKTTNTKSTKQISVEKMKGVQEDEDGDLHEMDEKVFTIDYADPFKMAAIAERHGFANEVRDLSGHNRSMAQYGGGYHDNWMDDYIMWSLLFNRPSPMYYGYGSGFAPRPLGFRPYAPAAPMNVTAVRGPGFGWIAARSAGRSNAFTSGIARNPPNVTHISPNSGAKVFSSTGGKGFTASAARGGFGGRAGGFSSGG